MPQMHVLTSDGLSFRWNARRTRRGAAPEAAGNASGSHAGRAVRRTASPTLAADRAGGRYCSPGGSSRWSLDHLFVDQEGVPTLVEVKRSSDTRARREVVAQMLD